MARAAFHFHQRLSSYEQTLAPSVGEKLLVAIELLYRPLKVSQMVELADDTFSLVRDCAWVFAKIVESGVNFSCADQASAKPLLPTLIKLAHKSAIDK